MDVKALVPRTRRAIDGAAADSQESPSTSLNDGQVMALVADAAADIIFYSQGRWGHKLAGADPDDYGAPTTWAIDPDLALEEQTVVVAQAALNHFFHLFKTIKVQEEIADESRRWSYSLSANLLVEQMKLLREQRDAALDVIGRHDTFETWVSFIEVRDRVTSAYIEPYLHGDVVTLPAGQEFPPDFRFGG